MKITLTGEDSIRLEPTSGALTIEAPSASMGYSPFHMLASALATCTFSVLQSWATHKNVSVDDLSLDVRWQFADDPHRVADLDVRFTWPSLPADRVAIARRVAALCTVHATLMHSPSIRIRSSSEPVEPAPPTNQPQVAPPASATVPPAPVTRSATPVGVASASMHGDPAAAPDAPVAKPAAT